MLQHGSVRDAVQIMRFTCMVNIYTFKIPLFITLIRTISVTKVIIQKIYALEIITRYKSKGVLIKYF